MIEYLDSARDCTEEDLRGFFAHWGRRPSPQTLLKILHASAFVVLAVDADNRRVVGYITAISDGISCAYIPHLEVLADYRGQGIGSQLVRLLLKQIDHLYMIDLICDEELRPFYAPLGFQSYHGMIRRNYDRQACD